MSSEYRTATYTLRRDAFYDPKTGDFTQRQVLTTSQYAFTRFEGEPWTMTVDPALLPDRPNNHRVPWPGIRVRADGRYVIDTLSVGSISPARARELAKRYLSASEAVNTLIEVGQNDPLGWD